MPNIKSSKKRMLLSKKQQEHNKNIRSTIRTFIKKTYMYISNNNKKQAEITYSIIQSILDRQANKNIIHKNKAARLKSKMMKKLNSVI